MTLAPTGPGGKATASTKVSLRRDDDPPQEARGGQRLERSPRRTRGAGVRWKSESPSTVTPAGRNAFQAEGGAHVTPIGPVLGVQGPGGEARGWNARDSGRTSDCRWRNALPAGMGGPLYFD